MDPGEDAERGGFYLRLCRWLGKNWTFGCPRFGGADQSHLPVPDLPTHSPVTTQLRSSGPCSPPDTMPMVLARNTSEEQFSTAARKAVKSQGSGHGGTWNSSSATCELCSLGHRLLRLTLLLCKIGIILPPTFLGFLWGLNSLMQSAEPVSGTK